MEMMDKKEYEIGFLVKDESEVSEVLKLLGREGAEINFEGPIKKINLAYKIKKEIQANFGYFHFRLEPEKIQALNNNLEINSAVLRFLILTPPFAKTASGVSRQPREAVSVQASVKKSPSPISNEELEKKIDEILQ